MDTEVTPPSSADRLGGSDRSTGWNPDTLTDPLAPVFPAAATITARHRACRIAAPSAA